MRRFREALAVAAPWWNIPPDTTVKPAVFALGRIDAVSSDVR
jgi:hypothetical protein